MVTLCLLLCRLMAPPVKSLTEEGNVSTKMTISACGGLWQSVGTPPERKQHWISSFLCPNADFSDFFYIF